MSSGSFSLWLSLVRTTLRFRMKKVQWNHTGSQKTVEVVTIMVTHPSSPFLSVCQLASQESASPPKVSLRTEKGSDVWNGPSFRYCAHQFGLVFDTPFTDFRFHTFLVYQARS